MILDVRKARFTVPRPGGDDVPAVLWQPRRDSGPGGPLVLIGHGGGMHKESWFIERLGRRMASSGCAALAIDLPHHGERTPPAERGLSVRARQRRLGLDGWRARYAAAAGQAVGDWQAAAGAADQAAGAPYGPVGYFGLSMGTRLGIPLVAAEPRVTAAVLGLFGHPAADPGAPFAREAGRVTAPVLFLLQRDDRVFAPADARFLFSLLGSADKTLEENPGGHQRVPPAAVANAVAFLRRRLRAGSGP